MKNYVEQSRKMRLGTVAIAVGLLLLGVGSTYAIESFLPTRHQLAVEAWNESNDTLTALRSQIASEELKNAEKFCRLVAIKDSDGLEVSDAGRKKQLETCFR